MTPFMPLKCDVLQAIISGFGLCAQMKLCLYNPNQVIKRRVALVWVVKRSWVSAAHKANRMRKGEAKTHQLRLGKTSVFLT